MRPDSEAICKPSEDVVAREIEGEFILVPLTASVGQPDEELYSLNATARAVWNLLDGHRTLREVAATLACHYDAPADAIEQDVIGLADELLSRHIVALAASMAR